MREIRLLALACVLMFAAPIVAAAIAEYGITGHAAPFTGGSVSHYVRAHE